MPAVKFCCECGELVRVPRAGFLPFRAFCRNCSPRFRTARLILLSIIAACTAIGFALGHYTSKREPFYLIGTPVGSNTSSHSANEVSNSPVNGDEAPKQPFAIKREAGAIDAICGAPTKSGKPCQRKVKAGGYCWQHRDKFRERSESRDLGSLKRDEPRLQ